ncbi:helix-turn-helix transcriptional regulator [Olivibacter jilunii]|uniref:helix-turn-helix transcriptional regulator n=1 Tax=Olivibacter jilunii TaxID=985016 RepID=UPI001031F69C|nr:WYL domain-containing protein [Olivibacter jilunii]
MESRLFSIGDVVTLKAHPYIPECSEIVISGDHIMLPPLMVIVEIYKAKPSFGGKKVDTFKYRCAWFSPKPYKFIYAEIEEEDLKLIAKCTSSINKNILSRGDKIVFKTASIELGKKKSFLTYDDNSLNNGIGSTVINSLLSFLPPILQVVDHQPHKTKHALKDKKDADIRHVPSLDIKFNFFDPTSDKVSSNVLPIEALELIEEVNPETISTLTRCIKRSGYLTVKGTNTKTVCKPRNIASRGGYYFLRAYDYLSNKVEEFEIIPSNTFTVSKTPFLEEAPQFDIVTTPTAATTQYINLEIIEVIKKAASTSSFIRIKYKNRNDQLSLRTVKQFEIVEVTESTLNVVYLIGYCLLRQDRRSFRIDRIQNVQTLDLSFK